LEGYGGFVGQPSRGTLLRRGVEPGKEDE
jgi:hypothetical protein